MATELELLAADEPAAYELFPGDAETRVIIVCDHASNRIPKALGGLGLDEQQLRDHIAWDIGAAAVTRRLQSRFGATAVLGNYSRLVVDLNRSMSDRSAMPPISDGTLVPGNLGLDAAARAARASALFEPYHAVIDRHIAAKLDAGVVPVFFGVHSFTPRFHGTTRPWHAGILWDRDPRLALPMLAALRREAGLFIGDNEPYSGRHPADYSIDHHAEAHGLAYAGIEIRQDLIADANGQDRWADRLSRAIDAAISDESVFQKLQDWQARR
jgi:predicted N-formylglutamate amidohydrolase